ncbi:hypothetical protein CYY_004392 [Polysphondylium violaceum]|uniref:ER-bound oxygenase mpaB/mpaB'/Rubber oxygenase catalytic domain-containing protein n=1 Tax=Polysphondylium violaceum TaxID=133409 RepID=A0A8J4PTE6_9MYCE|nr:hypothetical protein CYY_004392 [Polysphondylium violaceum]
MIEISTILSYLPGFLISVFIVYSTYNYYQRKVAQKKWEKRFEELDIKNNDHVDEIIKQIVGFDFPLEMFLSLNFAFYRTFCSPTISNVYKKTGIIAGDCEKRANDTDLLMHTWMDYGVDSEEGKASISHLNKIHGLHAKVTRNVDFLFVLCCLAADACDFCESYGSRKIQYREQLAIWEFYKRVGARMLLKDIPNTLEDCRKFIECYTEDNRQSRVNPDGGMLTEAFTKLVIHWYYALPEFVCRMAVSVLIYQMSETFHRKLDLAKPKPWEFALINGVLSIRKNVLKILPPRTVPYKVSDEVMNGFYGCPVSKETLSKVGPIDMLAKILD